MTSPPQLHGASFAHLVVRCAKISGPLLGVLVLMGWKWDVTALKSVVLGLPDMTPTSALALILAGVALDLLDRRAPGPHRLVVAKACAWGLLLIGGLSLFQRFLAPDLGFHDLLFRWTDWASRTPPSHTAPTTAVCLVLLGFSLLLLGSRAPYPAWCLDAPVSLAVLVALFAFNSNFRHALNLLEGPQHVIARGMGLHTAMVLILLGVGILCARPEQGLVGQLTRDTLGGLLARWLVPVSIFGPPLVTVALEVLFPGAFLSLPAKAALFSTVMSLGGVAMVLLSAQALNRIDTERRQANAALEASEERYRSLLETAPDAVVTVDGARRVLFMNAQAERLFGYPREELIGREVDLLIPELLRGQSSQGWFLRARHKNGTELPVEVSLSPFTPPEGVSVTAIIRDVTEREQYLEGLRVARAEAERERALLEAVVEHAPIGILFAAPSTDEVRLNSTLQAMMEDRIDPAAGRRQYLGRLRHLDGRPVSLEEFPTTRALEGHEVSPEKYVILREKGPLPVLASAAPVRAPTGEVRGVIVCIQDISAQEELDRLREEYVGLISHDLRSPLQNISLRCQLLLRSLQEKGLASEVASAESLLRNARRMSGMVEELLESSRLEAGQVQLHLEPLDMIHFLEEIIERDVPPDARERLRLEVATPVPRIPADAPRLERVLMNLLTNALKYSAPGTPVVVRLEREEAQVRISVRDQGKGLTPEESQRLFTKYYRTSSGKGAEGVGLGLYISRLIIEAHGGHIHVESAPGQGSTFLFTLPLTAPASAAEPQGEQPTSGSSPARPS